MKKEKNRKPERENAEMTSKTYIVVLMLDRTAGVWIAESDDIPGLTLKSGALEDLVFRLQSVLPQLADLEGLPSCSGFRFRSLTFPYLPV